MNISLNIEAGNPGELHEAIVGLAGIMSGSVAPQPETEKGKRVTKGSTKPEKQPDPEPTKEPEKAAEEKPDQTPDPVKENTNETPDVEGEKEEIPTVVELRAKAQEKGGTPEGKRAIKALLDEFGSKSISDVPEDKRSAFLQRLDKLGEEV